LITIMADTYSTSPNDTIKSPSDMFADTVEIQPSRQNFGSITNRTRPTVPDLSMGTLAKRFQRDDSNTRSLRHQESSKDMATMLEEQELDENDEAINKSRKSTKDKEKTEPKKFGTFDGVLARCLLCIWGVIMYLRTGWIVGNAGIWQTIIIMLLASSVTFLTSLSLSAICTNGEVKSGGYYFLISRSLGPEFGGVIGILFAFANCISVAMYLTGFSETIVSQYSPIDDPSPLTGSQTWDIVLWAEITLICILLMALRGVGGIIKFDMVLLVVLVMSIIVYFVGTFGVTDEDADGIGYTGYDPTTFKENWNANYLPGESFITVFSVFFPAVTGEMAGANISGDLRNPSYAIPHGTLSAIVISTLVYIGIALSLGGCVLRSVGDGDTLGLYYDYQIMPTISAFAPLVILGIFASTLSSALSCFVGAPRIFQAVCKDALFPRLTYFGKGRDKDGEPQRAYMIVFVICFLALLTGNINLIAPIITNFFLITYAVMNYSTFTWSLTRSPGWRPTFRWYNKWVSLLASAECIALMFMIDWLMALITVVVGLLMYKYVAYTEPNVNWGTAAEAITYVETCKRLIKYQTIKSHAKVQRPKFLIFNRNKKHTQQMYAMASIMNEKFQGITMIGDIIIGSPRDHRITNRYVRRARNHQYMDIPVAIIKDSLIQTCIAPSFVDGMRTILQTAGIGAIKPNVALLNMKDYANHTQRELGSSPSKPSGLQSTTMSPNSLKTMKSSTVPQYSIVPSTSAPLQMEEERSAIVPSFDAPDYIDGIQDALLTGMGVMMVAGDEDIDWTVKRNGFIDIWWLYDDGGLTVLIPYLLKSHNLWKDCKLRIMALENLGYSEQNELAALMTKLRIDAEIVPVRSDSSQFGGRISIHKDDRESRDKSGEIELEEVVVKGNFHKTSEGDKTPRDDVLADKPLTEDEEKTTDDQVAAAAEQRQPEGNPASPEQAAEQGIDLNNTLFKGSKLMVSSYVDMHSRQRSLRHEVFTYDHIDDLNPDNMKVGVSISESKKLKGSDKEEEDMKEDNVSKYARRKLRKYRKLGRLIERSKDSDLCIVTMPFPRAEYTSYEYMRILQSLRPKSMNNLIFVRGNQDQVLTFSL